MHTKIRVFVAEPLRSQLAEAYEDFDLDTHYYTTAGDDSQPGELNVFLDDGDIVVATYAPGQWLAVRLK